MYVCIRLTVHFSGLDRTRIIVDCWIVEIPHCLGNCLCSAAARCRFLHKITGTAWEAKNRTSRVRTSHSCDGLARVENRWGREDNKCQRQGPRRGAYVRASDPGLLRSGTAGGPEWASRMFLPRFSDRWYMTLFLSSAARCLLPQARHTNALDYNSRFFFSRHRSRSSLQRYPDPFRKEKWCSEGLQQEANTGATHGITC
jgi:hypothetical protein